MIKSIIFDGGGTIWDSMKILHDSYKWAFEQLELCNKETFPYILEDCNKLCSLKDFNTEKGKSKGFIALFLTKIDIKVILYSEDPNEKLINIVKDTEIRYKDFLQLSESMEKLLTKYLYEIFDDTKYPLCNSVVEALESLNQSGLLLAMVSNRRKDSTMKILNSHKLDNLFKCIITWEDQTRPKPSPEGIEKAMQKLNLKKEETIFVGDSSVDILSGKSAGLKTIGVLSGMGDYDILKKSGA
ncbi:MAG: hypothetical protein COU99_10740, partial [Sulfurimonas sp. CG10_big_fil_rev_8_21_14_0_10_36_24]